MPYIYIYKLIIQVCCNNYEAPAVCNDSRPSLLLGILLSSLHSLVDRIFALLLCISSHLIITPLLLSVYLFAFDISPLFFGPFLNSYISRNVAS